MLFEKRRTNALDRKVDEYLIFGIVIYAITMYEDAIKVDEEYAPEPLEVDMEAPLPTVIWVILLNLISKVREQGWNVYERSHGTVNELTTNVVGKIDTLMGKATPKEGFSAKARTVLALMGTAGGAISLWFSSLYAGLLWGIFIFCGLMGNFYITKRKRDMLHLTVYVIIFLCVCIGGTKLVREVIMRPGPVKESIVDGQNLLTWFKLLTSGKTLVSGGIKQIRDHMTLMTFLATCFATYKSLDIFKGAKTVKRKDAKGRILCYVLQYQDIADIVVLCVLFLSYFALVTVSELKKPAKVETEVAVNDLVTEGGTNRSGSSAPTGGSHSRAGRRMHKNKGGGRLALRAGASKLGSKSRPRRYAAVYDGDEIELHFRETMDTGTFSKKQRDKMMKYIEELGDTEEITFVINGETFQGDVSEFYSWMKETEMYDEDGRYDDTAITFRITADDYEGDDAWKYTLEGLPANYGGFIINGGKEKLLEVGSMLGLDAYLRNKKVEKTPLDTQAEIREKFRGNASFNSKEIRFVDGDTATICYPVISGRVLVLEHGFDRNGEVKIQDKVYKKNDGFLVHKVKEEGLYTFPAVGTGKTSYKIASEQGGEGDMVAVVKSDGKCSTGHLIDTTSYNASTDAGWCGSLVLNLEGQTPRILGLHYLSKLNSNEMFNLVGLKLSPEIKKKPP